MPNSFPSVHLSRPCFWNLAKLNPGLCRKNQKPFFADQMILLQSRILSLSRPRSSRNSFFLMLLHQNNNRNIMKNLRRSFQAPQHNTIARFFHKATSITTATNVTTKTSVTTNTRATTAPTNYKCHKLHKGHTAADVTIDKSLMTTKGSRQPQVPKLLGLLKSDVDDCESYDTTARTVTTAMMATTACNGSIDFNSISQQ